MTNTTMIERTTHMTTNTIEKATRISLLDAAITVNVHERLASDEMLGSLNANERNVMLLLAVEGATGRGVKMTEVSARLGISRAAMTALADRLGAEGLLQRRPSGTDRRVTELSLTLQGQLMIDEAFDTGSVAERVAEAVA